MIFWVNLKVVYPFVYRPGVLFENACIENKLSPRRAASVPEIADISASSATQCFLPESPARARGGKPLKKKLPKINIFYFQKYTRFSKKR